LTILIDFSDTQATIPAADLNNMLNQTGYTGYGNNGSVKDYFYDMSGGALTLTNNVIGYYRAVNPKAYYDTNVDDTTKVHELITEALAALDATNDFSTLTKNSNNEVIALNVLYAGSPSWGWSKGLWPHASGLGVDSYTGDGVTFNAYMICDIRATRQ
jgi:M6 family metalloprotease-like protein